MTFSTVLTSVTIVGAVVVRPLPERGQKGVIRRYKEIDYAISQLFSKKAVCKILYRKEE